MKPGPYLIWGLLGAAAIVTAGIFLGQIGDPPGMSRQDGERFRTSAILGGRSHNDAYNEFVGGEVTAFMGGVELDLRNSTMSGNVAVLDVFVWMGGIELRVPEDWVVVDTDATVILGGIEDRSGAVESPDARRLVIRGTVFMGGLDISN